jgi:hypothetical protein
MINVLHNFPEMSGVPSKKTIIQTIIMTRNAEYEGGGGYDYHDHQRGAFYLWRIVMSRFPSFP